MMECTLFEGKFIIFCPFVVVQSSYRNARLTSINQSSFVVGVLIPFFLFKRIASFPFAKCLRRIMKCSHIDIVYPFVESPWGPFVLVLTYPEPLALISSLSPLVGFGFEADLLFSPPPFPFVFALTEFTFVICTGCGSCGPPAWCANKISKIQHQNYCWHNLFLLHPSVQH